MSNPTESKDIEDRDSLIAHCKDKGIILHVHPPGVADEFTLMGLSIGRSDPGPRVLLFKEILPGSTNHPAIPASLPYVEARISIPEAIFQSLNAELQNEDSDIRRLSSWPITRTFHYVDVSDFSKHPPQYQVMVINSLIRLVEDPELWSGSCWAVNAKTALEAKLCIGDGYIFVFKDPLSAAYFAAFLAQLIELAVAKGFVPEFHFRMGVHVGPIYCFWDTGRGNWNYIGDGINGGQRVLSAIGKDVDDVLFLSSQVRRELTSKATESPWSQVLGCLQNKGRRLDKHGNPWRVYEVNHTELCSGQMPLSF